MFVTEYPTGEQNESQRRLSQPCNNRRLTLCKNTPLNECQEKFKHTTLDIDNELYKERTSRNSVAYNHPRMSVTANMPMNRNFNSYFNQNLSKADYKLINEAYDNDFKQSAAHSYSGRRSSFFNDFLFRRSTSTSNNVALMSSQIENGKKKKINVIEKLRIYRNRIQSKKSKSLSSRKVDEQEKQINYYYHYKTDSDCRLFEEKKAEIDDELLFEFMSNKISSMRRNGICEQIDKLNFQRQLVDFVEHSLREEYVHSFLV
jgi:hypothetical protein